MEPKPEPMAIEPTVASEVTMSIAEKPTEQTLQEPKDAAAETPTVQLVGSEKAPEAAVPAPVAPKMPASGAAGGPKEPILAVVLTALIFIVLAGGAYYAYSKTS